MWVIVPKLVAVCVSYDDSGYKTSPYFLGCASLRIVRQKLVALSLSVDLESFRIHIHTHTQRERKKERERDR